MDEFEKFMAYLYVTGQIDEDLNPVEEKNEYDEDDYDDMDLDDDCKGHTL